MRMGRVQYTLIRNYIIFSNIFYSHFSIKNDFLEIVICNFQSAVIGFITQIGFTGINPFYILYRMLEALGKAMIDNLLSISFDAWEVDKSEVVKVLESVGLKHVSVLTSY